MLVPISVFVGGVDCGNDNRSDGSRSDLGFATDSGTSPGVDVEEGSISCAIFRSQIRIARTRRRFRGIVLGVGGGGVRSESMGKMSRPEPWLYRNKPCKDHVCTKGCVCVGGFER